MVAISKYRLGFIALLLVSCTAQAAEPDYCELAQRAGIIFRGEVVAVERVTPAAPGEVPVLRITFRVREALRGATAGQLLTIHEWDGFGTHDTYRVGEMLVLFLHPPSGALGLTSTVGGPQGRISADNAAAALAAARAAEPFAEDVEPAPEPDIPEPQPWWERRYPAGRRGRVPFSKDRLLEIY